MRKKLTALLMTGVLCAGLFCGCGSEEAEGTGQQTGTEGSGPDAGGEKENAGVDFRFGTEVTNVIFEKEDGKKIAKAIECKVRGVEKGIMLTENDMEF